jgi:hypothetical protein
MHSAETDRKEVGIHRTTRELVTVPARGPAPSTAPGLLTTGNTNPARTPALTATSAGPA